MMASVFLNVGSNMSLAGLVRGSSRSSADVSSLFMDLKRLLKFPFTWGEPSSESDDPDNGAYSSDSIVEVKIDSHVSMGNG